MRKLGLFAFGVSTSVLAPTAIHRLQAGPQQVAKLLAPDRSKLDLHGIHIEVAADKGIADAGSAVTLTFTASATEQVTGKAHVAVDVLVYESEGTGGGRVELPPARVGYDELAFDVGTGGTQTKTLSMRLRGRQGETMGGDDLFGHYTVLVVPQGTANELEAKRARARRGNPMMDASGWYDAFETLYRGLGRAEPDAADDSVKPTTPASEVARLDVFTRPIDAAIAIHAADHGAQGADIPITVAITNPTRRHLHDVKVGLQTSSYQLPSATDDGGGFRGIADEQARVTEDGDTSVDLAPHETKTVSFHVAAAVAGTVGLFATAHCDQCDDNTDKWRPFTATAIDAIDIAPAAPEAKPAVVTANEAAPASAPVKP